MLGLLQTIKAGRPAFIITLTCYIELLGVGHQRKIKRKFIQN